MKNKILLILFSILSIFVSAETISIFDMQKKAELALEGDDLFSSIAIFKQIIELNPSYFDSRIGLSQAYFLLGEYTEASIHINEAISLNKNSNEAKILYGRILTGQAEFLEARNIFETILQNQKNNIDAILGIAELEVAEGNLVIAIDLYNNFLNKFPKNRKALVSTIILYDSIKKNDISDEYVDQVLFLYPEHPHVNYIAAKHYFETGKVDSALVYATRSYDIDSSNDDTIYLLSQIYISLEEFTKAVVLIERSLEKTRSNPQIWYLLGEIYLKLGDIDKSVYCYSTSLGYREQNELSRIALEDTLIEFRPLNDPLRQKYANYHFQNGVDLLNRNYANQARNEFRRGLLLAPHYIEGQKLYAKLVKTNGFYSKYLSMLHEIYSEQPDDLELADEIEIYTSIISDTVSNIWEIDQFLIEAPRFNIEVYLDLSSIPINSYNEGLYLGSYLIHTLHSFENIDANFNNFPTDFSTAYSLSRKSGSDYFIMFDFIDTDRSFSLEAKIYHSGTGSLLNTLPLFRTGNKKIILSLNKLSQIVSDSLPVWSKIIDRKADRILLNSGKVQGIETGDIFYIIRTEDLSIKKDSIDLDFDPGVLLGEVEITNTDDLISEGKLKKYNFFDFINPGDSLIKKTDTMEFPEVEETKVKNSFSFEVYKSIISIP